MTNTEDSYAHDIHTANPGLIGDALGRLHWLLPITWFHSFGVTYIYESKYTLRIGVGEPSVVQGNVRVYRSLEASVYAPGGAEIAKQEFPLLYYDSHPKLSSAKAISIMSKDDKIDLYMGSHTAPATNIVVLDKDLTRLDRLCLAVFKWATHMSGYQSNPTHSAISTAPDTTETRRERPSTRTRATTSFEETYVLEDETAPTARE